MPLYAYRCHECGQQFEVRQSFDDPPLVRHEQCGGNVERELTAPSLQFKGTGFYCTDYKKPAAPKEQRSELKIRYHRVSPLAVD